MLKSPRFCRHNKNVGILHLVKKNQEFSVRNLFQCLQFISMLNVFKDNFIHNYDLIKINFLASVLNFVGNSDFQYVAVPPQASLSLAYVYYLITLFFGGGEIQCLPHAILLVSQIYFSFNFFFLTSMISLLLDNPFCYIECSFTS